MLADSNSTSMPKNMELRFLEKISKPVLTCQEVKGEGNTCIEVVLINSSTGKKIEVGDVAFASVELVVLAQGTDDCEGEEFNEKIVRVEGNKLPLLTVNQCKLQGGSCVLVDLKFRHHTTRVKPTVFRLGARIVGTFNGSIVKEAKTESFAVKCYRSKYSMKNGIPNLTDKIWVLKNIHRRGNIEGRLREKGIDTVEKFLIHLLINHQELQNIALSSGKKWEDTTNHARKCQSNKMYWYFNSQENSGIVFDILGNLQGMYSRGANMLSEDSKIDADRLLSSALGHWEDVTSFDDLDSLRQHLEAVKASFNLSNSCTPGQYAGTNCDTGASEMVHGSNNIEFRDSLILDQGMPVNSLAHCESLGIHEYPVIDDYRLQLDQHFSIDNAYEVYGAKIDGTGSVLAESKEVEDAESTKMDITRKRKTSEAYQGTSSSQVLHWLQLDQHFSTDAYGAKIDGTESVLGEYKEVENAQSTKMDITRKRKTSEAYQGPITLPNEGPIYPWNDLGSNQALRDPSLTVPEQASSDRSTDLDNELIYLFYYHNKNCSNTCTYLRSVQLSNAASISFFAAVGLTMWVSRVRKRVSGFCYFDGQKIR